MISAGTEPIVKSARRRIQDHISHHHDRTLELHAHERVSAGHTGLCCAFAQEQERIVLALDGEALATVVSRPNIPTGSPLLPSKQRAPDTPRGSSLCYSHPGVIRAFTGDAQSHFGGKTLVGTSARRNIEFEGTTPDKVAEGRQA